MASGASLSTDVRRLSSGNGRGRGQMQHPTPDLMRLYSKMRDLRDELTLNELLNWRETPALSTSQLLPPTPDATTMSRSTSQASSCSGSVSQGLNGMSIAASPSSDGAPKRLGRHGPLTDFAKARTAFIRKLKACTDCRNRKVQCRHHNLELFEKEYRQQKTIHAPPAEMPPEQANMPWAPTAMPWTPGDMPWTPTPPPLARGQGAYTNDHRNRTSDLLRGVMSAQAVIPDTTQVLEAIDRAAGSSLSSAAVQPKKPSRVANDTTYMSTLQSPARHENLIPVGRQVDEGAAWECQGQRLGGTDCCRCQFPTIELLGAHFREIHEHFREPHTPYLFRCPACGCHNDLPISCFGCDIEDVGGFERWYYGSIIQQRPLAQFYNDFFPADEGGGQDGPSSSYRPGQSFSTIPSLAGLASGFGLGHSVSSRFSARSGSTISLRNGRGQKLSGADGMAKSALHELMTRMREGLSNSKRPSTALRIARYVDCIVIVLSLVFIYCGLLSWAVRKMWLRAYVAGRVFIAAEAMRQILGLVVPATGLFGQWRNEASWRLQRACVRERGVYT